jgi:hypothetical protein
MPNRSPNPANRTFSLWVEKLLTFASLLNFSLVAFDLSYTAWRDFFRSDFPGQPYASHLQGILWQIDLAFTVFFGLELLIRTRLLSRRYQVHGFDALMWRWYDLLLLCPFWRWLRIIPVALRLHQAKLINLYPLIDRLIKGFVSSIAVELTEVVVLRVLDQIQDLLRQGDLARWLLRTQEQYIDLNQVDEGQAIAQHLVTLLAYKVLPQLKPDIEALMHHSLTRVLSASPAYSGLQKLPGLGTWSNQLTHQMVAEVSQNTYQALIASLEDPEGIALIQKLLDRFGTTLSTEAQQSQSIDEIQSLLVALLEEIKVNYVQQLSNTDPEALRAETRRLYGETQGMLKKSDKILDSRRF